MTTPASGDAAEAGRIEFSTTDSERAIAYFNDVYRTSLRITGARDGHLYRHSRVGGGSFAINNVRVPLHIGVRRDPLDALIIVQIGVGRIEREYGGVSERFLTGDVFVDSVPGVPATMRMLGVDAQTVMLDLGVLAQVAAVSPARGAGPIRLTSFRPRSALAGLQWHAAHPLAGRHHVTQRVRHADLRREVGLQRQLSYEREVVFSARGYRFAVYPAQPILAIGLRHRSEVIANGVPELLQPVNHALLIVGFTAVGEQQVDDFPDAG